jgi:hypothetical protein
MIDYPAAILALPRGVRNTENPQSLVSPARRTGQRATGQASTVATGLRQSP